ncbi:MAG: hypothetical protein RPR28_07720 [Cycloclasticus sp.]
MVNLLPHVAEYSNQYDSAEKSLMIDIGPIVGLKVIKLLTMRHKSMLSQLRHEKHNVLKMQGALGELENLIKDLYRLQ